MFYWLRGIHINFCFFFWFVSLPLCFWPFHLKLTWTWLRFILWYVCRQCGHFRQPFARNAWIRGKNEHYKYNSKMSIKFYKKLSNRRYRENRWYQNAKRSLAQSTLWIYQDIDNLCSLNVFFLHLWFPLCIGFSRRITVLFCTSFFIFSKEFFSYGEGEREQNKMNECSNNHQVFL